MSTLPFGASPGHHMVGDDLADLAKCNGSLADYVGDTGDMFDMDRESSIVHWITRRGPHVPAEHANGCEKFISNIWTLVQKQNEFQEDLNKAGSEYENQKVQVEKVKRIQIDRWGPDHPKMRELDQWAGEKLNQANQKCALLQDKLKETVSMVSLDVKCLLEKLNGNLYDDCADLLAETDSLFSGLTLSSPQKTPDSVMMDATSNALEKVGELPDGPQKAALTAVLEVAATSPPQVGIYIYIYNDIDLENP